MNRILNDDQRNETRAAIIWSEQITTATGEDINVVIKNNQELLLDFADFAL